MDWADEKAGEWVEANLVIIGATAADVKKERDDCEVTLAALLREVVERAERRVEAEWVKAVREVRKSQGRTHNNDWNGGVDIACDEILRRMSTNVGGNQDKDHNNER